MKILPQVIKGRRVGDLHLHAAASQHEAKIFSQSENWEDYLRTISRKLMGAQQKLQPAVQAAPDHQLQAPMGHKMRPLNAVPVNSPAPALPRTASTVPVPQRPPEVQNMQFNVQQSHPSNFPPAAPVVQLHARRPAVTQIQNQGPTEHNSGGIYTQQPHPQQQDLRVTQRQSYHTYVGQPSNVATMQTGHPDGQNNQQSAVEVDWREDIFQKITSLKDAHLLELVEFELALRARVLQSKTKEQLKALPEEKADEYKKAASILASIRCVLNFLHLKKSNITEHTKDHFDKCQISLYTLLRFYRNSKVGNARKNVGLQSQNCRGVPQVVNITGATDNSQQKHQEYPAAEAFPHPSQNVPSRTPLTQQQNQSDHLAGEAENVEVRPEAETLVAVSLTSVTGDTAPFSGGTCSQEVQQEHPTDEAISELTHDVSVSPPAQHSAHSVHVEAEVEAEAPVAVEGPIKRGDEEARPLSSAALRSVGSDMGVIMKRAFSHTTPGTMDGSSCAWSDESSEESCHKRRKTHYASLPDEIRAARSMLVESQTDISINEDNTGGADGTVIELSYNAVSLAPQLSAAIGASEIRTKLLVPADYPESSPVILGGDGEWRKGAPGVVDVAFRRALVLLPEPWSIEGMAMAWDSVTRRAVGVFAHRLGGGMFSTRYVIPV